MKTKKARSHISPLQKLKRLYRHVNTHMANEFESSRRAHEKKRRLKETRPQDALTVKWRFVFFIPVLASCIILSQALAARLFGLDCHPFLCLNHTHSFEFYVENFVLLYACLHIIDVMYGRKVISLIERNFIPLMVAVIALLMFYQNILESGSFESRYFSFQLAGSEMSREYGVVLYNLVIYSLIVGMAYTEQKVSGSVNRRHRTENFIRRAIG